MLGGAAAFAVMSLLTGVAGQWCDWQYIAIVRTSLALLLAGTYAVSAGAKLVFFKPATLWMRSIAGSVSLVSNFYALTQLPVSDVLTITNMFPLWVAILSWPLLGSRPTADIWAAAVVGIIGVALVQQPHLRTGGLPLAACVLSSFTSAVALIGLHRLKELDPRAIVAHFSGVSLLFCLAAAVIFPLGKAGVVPTGSRELLTLVADGVTATMGQLMLTKAFASGPPAQVAVVNLTQIGYAAILEMLFLGRTFSPLTLLGMSLVLAPTAWVLLRQRTRSVV